ncbi:hypothetical protein PanWU01x14_315880 [Parasponia andersonii]|uniref:Uncharacterized protein n=1 Tax=Parasponia andersonii TaxID=3476 RepID=A0A2P5AN80_PARAD|nr:hypothetical protein PanWU01x14_315880 [Parasponia andersonii]
MDPDPNWTNYMSNLAILGARNSVKRSVCGIEAPTLRMPPRRVPRHQQDAETPRPNFTHLIEVMQQAFVQMSNPDYQPPAPRECQLDQANHLQQFMRLQPG